MILKVVCFLMGLVALWLATPSKNLFTGKTGSNLVVAIVLVGNCLRAIFLLMFAFLIFWMFR